MTTNQRLRQLKEERGLTINDIRDMTSAGRSIVYAWLADDRNMPDAKLELLEMKLEKMMKRYDVFVNVKEDGNDVWATDLNYEEARKAIEDARYELGNCCLNAWMEPVSTKRRSQVESGF